MKAFVISLALVIPSTLMSQSFDIDRDQLEELVRRWDFAHNAQSSKSFEEVYADRLMFYTETVSETRAIKLKQQLFKSKPYFSQRISSAIRFTPFTSGVVKGEFTKSVREKSGWKNYPSYLLISYQNSRYEIVGESDYRTDRVLKFNPKIGEAITFSREPKQVERPVSREGADFERESIVGEKSDSTPSVALIDSTTTPVPLPQVASIDSREVAVPVDYIYMLIGILALGGLMLFVAATPKRAVARKETVPMGNAKIDAADKVVHDFQEQSVFESFVVRLFDPLFFKYRRPKPIHVLAGGGTDSEYAPDLEFEFNNKEIRNRFAIKYKYYPEPSRSEVQIFSHDIREAVEHFARHRDIPVYYLLGFGGTPDDPRELYFIPATEVNKDFIPRSALKTYSKSGMFYYNRSTERIH